MIFVGANSWVIDFGWAPRWSWYDRSCFFSLLCVFACRSLQNMFLLFFLVFSLHMIFIFLFICMEPTNGFSYYVIIDFSLHSDWKARADVAKLLKHLKKELTLLVVSHDLRYAQFFLSLLRFGVNDFAHFLLYFSHEHSAFSTHVPCLSYCYTVVSHIFFSFKY